MELAARTKGTMPWHGRVFPRCQVDDGEADTPEALPAEKGLLPHLHEDWEDRFPRAFACDALESEDPPEDAGLEARGTAIGGALGTSCGEKK